MHTDCIVPVKRKVPSAEDGTFEMYFNCAEYILSTRFFSLFPENHLIGFAFSDQQTTKKHKQYTANQETVIPAVPVCCQFSYIMQAKDMMVDKTFHKVKNSPSWEHTA